MDAPRCVRKEGKVGCDVLLNPSEGLGPAGPKMQAPPAALAFQRCCQCLKNNSTKPKQERDPEPHITWILQQEWPVNRSTCTGRVSAIFKMNISIPVCVCRCLSSGCKNVTKQSVWIVLGFCNWPGLKAQEKSIERHCCNELILCLLNHSAFKHMELFYV